MANTVRIRNGMSNATEGDILGNFGDLVGVGVVDKANGHLLVTQDSPRGMSIQVAGGIVYVPNAGYNQLDSDTPKFYPVVCDAEALTIDNNTSGQTRNDIVCVKVDKSIFPDADASNIATKIVVKGTAGGGIPTTPANHYKLANIVVVNGETEITNAEITDTREQVLLEAGTVDSRIDDKMTNIMDIMLPVGVTIMFADNLDHSNHAGKTWVRTSVGRTPVGIDTTQTEFDTIGETGGAKTHTLSIAEMPTHKHGLTYRANATSLGDIAVALSNNSGSGGVTDSFTANVGGGVAHNNLQPYEVFAFWKRIA